MGNVIALRPGQGAGSWEERAQELAEPGQDEAARLVFLVHEPALRRRALRLARPRDAEWLIRETFEIFLQQRDRAGATSGLVVWLFTVMNDLYLGRLRQERRLRVVGADAEPSDPPVQPPAWARVRRSQFVQAMTQLPAPFRQVFELHAVDGLSYGEIGARLELTPMAVFARLFRARLLLKDLLMDAVEEEGVSA